LIPLSSIQIDLQTTNKEKPQNRRQMRMRMRIEDEAALAGGNAISGFRIYAL
jgi:hypothetical protein